MNEIEISTKSHKIKVIAKVGEIFDRIVICLHGFNGNMWGDAYHGLKKLLTKSMTVI